MNLKRLVEISPLLVSFLIFNGFLKLYLFYHHWNIEIINYLDFSEIILSFLNDLNVVILFCAIILFQSLLGYKLMESSGKITSSKDHSEQKNIIKDHVHISLSKEIEILYTRRTGRALLILSAICLICCCFFIATNQMFFLYLVMLGVIQILDLFFGKFISVDEKITNQFNIILSILIFTISISYHEIKLVEKNSPKRQTKIFTSTELIETTKDFYIIGKTQRFTFLFNSIDKKTAIITNSEIKKEEIFTAQ